MIKAVIFDMDGLMVDTEMISCICYREILESYGFSFTKEDYIKDYPGRTLMTSLQFIKDKYHIDDEELPWTDLKPATPTDNKQLPWTELKPATTTQNKEDNKVVQTSDTTSITMLMSTLFASSGALYILKKRKHK